MSRSTLESASTLQPAPTVAVVSDRRLTCIDLFSGAGGLSLGLQQVGYTNLLSVDNWAPALRTLEHNFGDASVCGSDVRCLSAADLRDLTNNEVPMLVAGGPPCQGFTSAGARNSADKRNTLVHDFARLVAELQPKWFLFENVEGILTMSDGDFIIDLLDLVFDAGYRVRLRKINVANYGVPQLRKRVIALGMLGADPGFPEATHRAYGAPGAATAQTTSLPPASTLSVALQGLDAPALSADLATIQGHYLSEVAEADALRYRRLRPGQTMRDLPVELRHKSFERRANRRVADGMPSERRGGAPAGVRRLRPDEPSKAITSASSREFVHPLEDRCLTLRECARVQGFPDSFEFLGSRAEQATLIGNAIPPTLGSVFGQWIANMGARSRTDRDNSSRLLEFRATSGRGMSPVLDRVVRRVSTRYSIGEMQLWN